MTYETKQKASIIFVILAFITVVIMVGLFVKDVEKSRIGQKIDYWLSEPNERTITTTN